jgi:hypothetical protein
LALRDVKNLFVQPFKIDPSVRWYFGVAGVGGMTGDLGETILSGEQLSVAQIRWTPHVQELSLVFCSLEDLDFLKNSRIEVLSLQFVTVDDISALSKCETLREIAIRDCGLDVDQLNRLRMELPKCETTHISQVDG